MSRQKNPVTALTITDEQKEFTDEQVASLRAVSGWESVPRKADLDVLFHHVKRTGLDPFAKQIYLLGRNTKNRRTNQWETRWTVQTGIDGYRLVARRAADAAQESLGYDDATWCDESGNWRDVWTGGSKAPFAAKVTVLRAGQRFSSVALMSEFGATDRDGNATGMWRNMPSNQLAKCAEALALRKAFPQDLAGIYIAEEMDQAAREAEPEAVQVSSTPATSLAAVPDIPDGERDWKAEIEAATSSVQLQQLWRECNAARALDGEMAAVLTRKATELTQIEGASA